MTTLRTPTMRYGHPLAGAIWLVILLAQHLGWLDALGLTPELVLELGAGAAAAAAAAFAAIDHRWATAAARELGSAESDLRHRVERLRERAIAREQWHAQQGAPARVELDTTPVDGPEGAP